MDNKIWTKAEIKSKLVSGNRDWLTRGLMAIYEKQTSQEKLAMTTVEDNKVGFNGVDAEILSSFAEQWRNRNWLSEKQFAILAKKMPKYAGQLAKIAEEKSKASESRVLVVEISESMDSSKMISFSNGARIWIGDMQPQIHDDEVVAWRMVENGVEYVAIND